MKRLITIVAMLTLGLPLCGQAAQESAPSFAGRWRSTPYGIPLGSELDVSVYGPHATSVRLTELVLDEHGRGTATVTRRVTDRRGQTVAGTRSVEEVQFELGAAEHTPGGRPHYAAKIVKAERRYPDTPGDRWPIDGARLELIPSEDPRALDIRFDTPEGTGSFSETLRRVGPAQARRNTAKS